MKKIFAMMLALALLTMAGAAMAEEFATEKQNALNAFKVSMPDAAVDYTVRDRDDGRYEWDIFFTQGTQIGVCEVLESTNEIRKVKLYEKPAGALTASEAVKTLEEKKGAVTVVDLDLERDDGRLVYEGEVELDGKRYEFEMKVTGEVIEWERD